MKFKRPKKRVIIILIIVIIMIFIIWQNNDIVTTQIDYNSSNLPKEFNGYKIVHISDLHNKKFGNDQNILLNKIKNTSPDIIVITGDLIDRRKYDFETSMVFIKGAVEIASVYFVSGNHEAWSGEYENIKSDLIDEGVEVIDDRKVEITKGDSSIEMLGLSDPAFLTTSNRHGINLSSLEEHLEELSDDAVFKILLSHRPELFDIYAEQSIDIIFSGHAHGGQFRLPFSGGLFAPGQGFFPEYTSGIHIKEKSALVVSRGLGNSMMPIRIFNRPEIVVVTLENK